MLLGLIYVICTLLVSSCHRKQIQSHTDTTTVYKNIPVEIKEESVTERLTPGTLYSLPIGKHIEFIDSTNSVKGEIYRDSIHYIFTSTRIAQKDTVTVPLKEFHHYHTETRTISSVPWYAYLICIFLLLALLVAMLKR